MIAAVDSEAQPEIIDAAAQRRAMYAGLNRDESFELWVRWRALGGMNRGVDLAHLVDGTLPAWLVEDFLFLERRYFKRKRQRENLEKSNVSSNRHKPKPARRR